MDTDNDSNSGGAYADCNGMTGIDRFIGISAFGAVVYNGVPEGGGVLLGTGTYAIQAAITEISLPLSMLGFSSGTCPSTIPTAIYFNNAISDPNDNVPLSGTFNINCGGPTAVTLDSLQAQPTTSPALPVALIGVSAAALIGVVFLIRRRKTA
jgi:hypothetical protein